MAASDNSKKLDLEYQEAASLELQSMDATCTSNPDELAASLDAVANLRSAITHCRGLQVQQPLATPTERLVSLVAEAGTQGLREPTPDYDAAWRLMTTCVTCSMALVKILYPPHNILSLFWSTPLNTLAQTLGMLQARL